jgi:hypothetical protein
VSLVCESVRERGDTTNTRPQPLELTAADELLAADSLDILRQNGFEVEVIEDSGTTAPHCHRLQLVAQPVSKGTMFDMKGEHFIFGHSSA